MKKARPFRSGQKWMENNWEEIEYNWVKGNLIPEQLIDILCEQYVEGVQIRIGIMMMVMIMKVLR